MKEGSIASDVVIITNQQPPEVAQPSEGAFDFPTVPVAAQGAAIVERGLAASAAVRVDQQDSPVPQPFAQRVAVVGPVGDDAQRSLLWPSAATAGHRNLRQGTFGQSHFARTGRDQLASQRNTLAVDHHHPLRAFAALGFADALAPFLAGAKLPSRNDSLQSNLPR
jgi:hypothetical protein